MRKPEDAEPRKQYHVVEHRAPQQKIARKLMRHWLFSHTGPLAASGGRPDYESAFLAAVEPGGKVELHRALGLVLHHHGSSCHLFAVADVPNLEANEATASQIPVDTQVEESKFAHPISHLEARSQCRYVFDLERRRLLADDLALVPCLSADRS